MPKYAAGTEVPVERSRGEIERILTRYGATAFAYMSEQGRAVIMFEAHGRRIRFDLRLPTLADCARSPAGRARTGNSAHVAWEQACRQRWRALALCVKAKLEAVESEIAEFEQEFAAYIMLPDGGTVGEWLKPQIARAYDSNEMPALMAGT